jgi:hypothetical protein
MKVGRAQLHSPALTKAVFSRMIACPGLLGLLRPWVFCD